MSTVIKSYKYHYREVCLNYWSIKTGRRQALKGGRETGDEGDSDNFGEDGIIERMANWTASLGGADGGGGGWRRCSGSTVRMGCREFPFRAFQTTACSWEGSRRAACEKPLPSGVLPSGTPPFPWCREGEALQQSLLREGCLTFHLYLNRCVACLIS